MPNRHLPTALALLLSTALTPAIAADKPYSIDVWADVRFGQDGRAGDIRILDEAANPAKFIEAVKTRIAAIQIDPPQDAGQPAELRTGMRLRYTVTPSERGGDISLSDIRISPLAVRQPVAGVPRELAREGSWEGKVITTCMVSVEGLCGQTESRAESGVLPEGIRRYARDAMAKWKFEPQRLNGRPVEGEYIWELDLSDKAPEINDPRRRR